MKVNLKGSERLKIFEKMLLIKALCEEKLMMGIIEFVKSTLGNEFIESPPFNL